MPDQSVPTYALELDEVDAGYGQRKVIRGVSLRVATGAIVALLGANGAGKTTTLRAISGVIRHRGTITCGDVNVEGRNPERVAKLGVGHVAQGRGTFPNLTVEENLKLGLASGRGWLGRRKRTDEDMDRWTTFFPILAERLRVKAGTMSGGEQQMLAIARAMMGKPKVLLLDEPSLGLAPIITQDLMARLAELNKTENVSILLVEQNAKLALQIADWAYAMEVGSITLDGPAAALAADDRIRKAYLGV